MPKKNRGLGKGLDALLGFGAEADIQEVSIDLENQQDSQSSQLIQKAHESDRSASFHAEKAVPLGRTQAEQLKHLPIECLVSGQFQPRTQFKEDALKELAQSIQTQGMMQPIIVRQLKAETFEIIAGERRWRAAQLAGLQQVPCLIKVMSDETALAMALIENMQREDLNPIEEAQGLKRLKEEFTLTHQQIADSVGKSRVSVTNLLRLNNLTEAVQALLINGEIEMGHGRTLLAIPNEQQLDVANEIIQKGLSVREAEQLVKRVITPSIVSEEKALMDPNIVKLQSDLSDKLGAKVKIQHQQNGKGKVLIHYLSLEELEGVLEHIK